MKKTISILLALVMLLGVLSVGASALSEPKTVHGSFGTLEVLRYAPSQEFKTTPSAAQVNRFLSNDPNAPYTFYSTLNTLQKEIYNGILNGAKPQAKHKISITTPIQVHITFTVQNGVAQPVYPADFLNTYMTGVYGALSALMDDHPEMFWIGNTDLLNIDGRILNEYADGSVDVAVDTILIDLALPDGYSDWNAVKTAYNSMMQAADDVQIQGATRFEQVKFIHDWIANRASYDDDFAYATSYYATSVFLAPYITVCEGYSEAFKMLCDRAGIPCIVVVGDAGGPHAWNYVKMEDGKWYAVDVTWDDGWKDANGKDLIIYDYFLRGTNSTEGSFVELTGNTFGKTHMPTGERYQSDETLDVKLSYPTLAAEGYMRMLLMPGSVATVDKGKKEVYLPEGTTLEESFLAPEGYELQQEKDGSKMYVVKGDTAVEVYTVVRLVKGRPGDVNLDGNVTATDARWALQAANKARDLNAQQYAAANVNGDEKITAVDARWILQAATHSREL